MKKLILAISLLAAISAQAIVVVPHISVPVVHVASPVVHVTPPAPHVAPPPVRIAPVVKAAAPVVHETPVHEPTPIVVRPVIVPHTPAAPVAKRPASAASKVK